MADDESQGDAQRDDDPANDRDDDEQRRRPGRLRVRRLASKLIESLTAQAPIGALALTGAGIGIVVVVIVLLVNRKPAPTEVPNLVGLSRVIAEAQLHDRGLILRATYDQASSQPVGTVLQTDPSAGVKLARGEGVSLVLAVGGLVSMPTPVPGSTAGAPGAPVIVQPPAPGGGPPVIVQPPIIVQPPSVSPGPEQRQVPDLTDVDVTAARQKLLAIDLSVGSVTAAESAQPVGRVLSTNPTAGVVVRVGSAVNLVVAKPLSVTLGAGSVLPHTYPSPCACDCRAGYQVGFSQQITATQSGRVTYRWLRSSGSGPPDQYIDFAAAGTQVVTDQWRLTGNPGDQLRGWEQLEILSPADLPGQRLSFYYNCPSDPTATSVETPAPR